MIDLIFTKHITKRYNNATSTSETNRMQTSRSHLTSTTNSSLTLIKIEHCYRIPLLASSRLFLQRLKIISRFFHENVFAFPDHDNLLEADPDKSVPSNFFLPRVTSNQEEAMHRATFPDQHENYLSNVKKKEEEKKNK